MKTLKAQEGFARLASGLIVLAAIILTFDGTVRFAHAHGALGWRGAAIAGMNDLAVLVGILWPRRPLQALAGLCASFTIWANIDHAAPGAGGLAVALIPPLLAILMVAALERVAHQAHEPGVAQAAEPVSQAEPIHEPVSQPSEPPVSHEPVVSQGSIRPAGSLRTQALPVSQDEPREPLHLVREPKVSRSKTKWTDEEIQELAASGMKNPEIVAHTGLSLATVKRRKKVA